HAQAAPHLPPGRAGRARGPPAPGRAGRRPAHGAAGRRRGRRAGVTAGRCHGTAVSASLDAAFTRKSCLRPIQRLSTWFLVALAGLAWGFPVAANDPHVLVLGRVSDDPKAHYEQLKPLLDYIVPRIDRKSTRLNSSHVKISYAVF